MVAVIVTLYLLFQVLLCFYLSKKITNEKDYLQAGQTVGLFFISLSLFATWFGAETCLGSSGAVYAEGLAGSRADPFGYSLCLFLSGILIAHRLWSKSRMTLADFYRERFGPMTTQLAVWILAISSLIWGAAQLRAFGEIIEFTFGWNQNLTLTIGFLFVLFYTTMGGLKGDILTDVIQAVVIVGGLGTLLIAIIMNHPNLVQSLTEIPPERWSFKSQDESWLARLDRWAVPILGSLVAQEIASRILASQTSKIATKACFYGGFIYLFLGCLPVFLGLLGPSLLPELNPENQDQFLLHLASQQLSPLLLGLFAGALLSALLSTIDSILISSGGLISHNILIPFFRITNESQKLKLGRGCVVAVGLIAFALAFSADGIFELLEMASSFGTSGILVITLMGLWFPYGSGKIAGSTLVVGLVTTPLAEHGFGSESPFLISVMFSFLFYLAGASIEGIFKRNSAQTV